MYNQEIKDIEDKIQKIEKDVNTMLVSIARHCLTEEETNQITVRLNSLLEYSGKVSESNMTEILVAVKYFERVLKHIMKGVPSMEDSLCEFYTAMLHHSPELRVVFDQLWDSQKIDLTGAVKDIGGFEIKDATITKAQVLEYLKRKGE